jgi:hypothetical protein
VSTTHERGRELEQLLGGYLALHNYQVCHNVVIEGRSGARHELDVVGDKSDGLSCFRLVVDCKAWNAAIDKDIVYKPAGVLADLGVAKGVIAALFGELSTPPALSGSSSKRTASVSRSRDLASTGTTPRRRAGSRHSKRSSSTASPSRRARCLSVRFSNSSRSSTSASGCTARSAISPQSSSKHSRACAPLREATERSRWVCRENEDARRTQLSAGGIQTSPLKRRPRTSSAPTSSTRGAAGVRPARKLERHNQPVRRNGAIPSCGSGALPASTQQPSHPPLFSEV